MIALLRGAAMVLLPAVVCAVLMAHFFSATFRDAIPWQNDEVAYWLQIAAFRRAGLDTGYFVVNERPSPVSISRFGPHGPVFPVTYGLLARATGWRRYSAPLLGIALIAAAGAVWWRRTAPPHPWLTGLLLATFWPMVLFMPTAMQEPLHFAFAFAFAAAAHSLVRRGRLTGAEAVAGAALLLLAALIRPVWALVLLPVAAIQTAGARPAIRGVALAAAATGAAMLYVAFITLAAPYPGSPGATVLTNLDGLLPLVGLLADRVAMNARALITPSLDQPMQTLLRVQYVAALAVALVGLARATQDRTGIFIAILLTATLAALLAVGDVEAWRDYRVLSPLLLVAALMGVSSGARWTTWLAVSNVVLAPLAVHAFVALHQDRFMADPTRIDYFARDMARLLESEPRQRGWGHTILLHVDAYDYHLLGLPAGMGVAGAMHWDDVPMPAKSRFVLLRRIDEGKTPTALRLRPIGETIVGTVYENLDWARNVQAPRDGDASLTGVPSRR